MSQQSTVWTCSHLSYEKRSKRQEVGGVPRKGLGAQKLVGTWQHRGPY